MMLHVLGERKRLLATGFIGIHLVTWIFAICTSFAFWWRDVLTTKIRALSERQCRKRATSLIDCSNYSVVAPSQNIISSEAHSKCVNFGATASFERIHYVVADECFWSRTTLSRKFPDFFNRRQLLHDSEKSAMIASSFAAFGPASMNGVRPMQPRPHSTKKFHFLSSLVQTLRILNGRRFSGNDLGCSVKR